MKPKKKRLEVTVLTWKYALNDRTFNWCRDYHSTRKYVEQERRYVTLPEHDCPYKDVPHGCGIVLDSIDIQVGDNGRGVCSIHHPELVMSGTGDHELEVLLRRLHATFLNEENVLIFGGGGITCVYFEKRRGQHLTDTAMEIYKRIIPILGSHSNSWVIGPQVVRRTYCWNIELQGWVAFEDRLALTHGLRPFNQREVGIDKGQIRLYTDLDEREVG